MSDPQPEYVWAYSDEKPKRGRMWLIVALAVAAVVIAALVFWLFLRPGAPLASATPKATATATPTSTPTASASPSASASASASASPEPSETAITTPPPAPDPDIGTFRGKVQGWVDDAGTGLDIVSSSSGQEALAVIDALQADAQRLSDTPAPSSIASEWNDKLSSYEARLGELRSAASDGSTISVGAARTALQSLRALVGL